ncbi:hypothetical protein CRM22_010895 [Opisthorchis felineus]|uniref:Peptidase A1 domain-containing protein n=1 Tax=Opisthorchis felineus TaxID=147828 RepID=A0A4V3SAQ2_OPIFE|nr:hypothetical protein CRM22_010895 [Opisthorchis felineus]
MFYVSAAMNNEQKWIILVDGFQIGESKFVHDRMAAVIDSGCPWIQLSADSLAEIHQIITPIRFKDGFHYIDCSKRSKLPVIHFLLFGGQRLSLGPEYYVFKDKTFGLRTECYLRIRVPTSNSISSPILGIPVLKKYYTVFDEASQRIGFAPANPDPNNELSSASVF